MKNTYLITTISLLLLVLVFARDFQIDTERSLSVNDSINHSNSAVSIVSIEDNDSLAAIFFANSKEIKWISNNLSSASTVDINLLRKVSGDPIQYELVRKIVKNTPNDGSYLWSPYDGELNQGYYIEVTCSEKTSILCVVSGNPLGLDK
jgi:hypothetical protein